MPLSPLLQAGVLPMAASGWFGTLCHPSGPAGSARLTMQALRLRGRPWHSGKKAAFLKGSPTGKQELGCSAPRCAPGCPCRSAGSSEALLPAAPGQGGAAVASLPCAPAWAEVAPGAAGSRWTAGPGRREGAPWTRDVVMRVALQRTPNPAPSSCAPRSLVQSFIRSVHLLVWGTGATPGKETGHQETSHHRDSGSGKSELCKTSSLRSDRRDAAPLERPLGTAPRI